MFDSKLPENLQDSALNASVYAYNRTPYKSNGMCTLLYTFAPSHDRNIDQIKRYGYVSYIKIQRRVGPKFRANGQRVILVGYIDTGYIFFKPEEGKYYESSRNVKFNKSLVYGDNYGKNNIKYFLPVEEEIDKETWFCETKKHFFKTEVRY